MGCFSFICKKSGKAVISDSFSGNAVHLFLLEKGKVIEHMFGNYDSYGRVFSDKKYSDDSSFTEFSSFEWKKDWDEIVNIHFSKDESSGIAAILADCWKEGDVYPTERSLDDPNQGWGKDLEYIPSFPFVSNPFHKIMNV
jgi:hypothetical protein